MASGQVKFSASETPSVEELAGGAPSKVNFLSDAAGAQRLRPGIAAWTDFPAVIPNASSVIGIGSWGIYVIYVTADRKIWAVSSGVVTALSSAAATTQLDGGLRPVIVATRTRVIISGGGKPQKWEGAGLSSRLGGSPPAFSHVATISQRVVGNDSGLSGIIYWSGIGDTGAETWLTGLNFREAETRQDPVTGMYVNSNELVALGTETIQMLSPDPSEVFTNARTIEVGWGAPHSYIGMDEQFMGMDARNRAIMCNGRSFSAISPPAIGKQLEDVTDPSDCFGFRYKFENYDLGVLNFPTDGRAFAYDTPTKNWSEFRGYDTAHSAQGAFPVTASFFWADQNLTLVGLATGQIAILDRGATTDLGDPIVGEASSSFEDRGVSRLKKCNAAYVKFRRGILADQTSAKALLSYRDNTGPFCDPFELEIGDASDVDPVITLRSLGTYQQRQWRITVDSAAFSFVGINEDFTILDR
jgi:hypothetical protein